MDDVERQKQVLLKRMARLDEELTKLESIPRDEYEDLTVLRFKMRFVKNFGARSPWFNYAAIKVQGNWYLTGGPKPKMTWTEMQDWWAANEIKKLRIATSWSKVEDTSIDLDEGPIFDDRSTD